jgi:hypothetical protein
MSEFAKLFGTGDDQVLVMIQGGEEGDPEVRTFFQPKDLGVCSVAMKFTDSDAGWDSAEAAFDKIDEAKARAIVDKIAMEPLTDEVKK